MSPLFATDLEAVVRRLRHTLTPLSDAVPVGAPGGQRIAAVLAPLYLRAGRPHLLFTRRAATLNAHSGEMSFPGGSHEPGDGALEQTALREALEEIGLASERVLLLGTLEPVVTVVSNFTIIPFVGLLPDGPGLLHPNPYEVAEIIEAPLAALADPAIFHSEEWVRAGQPHTVYFFDYGPHRIWGATARMLVALLGLLRQEEPPENQEPGEG
ncbi:MAG TPA: CoA pyrophosphatase [Ktedonobacterales bacterium]|nr:CoA pyrophosphatase [Ktedonobacterales bacterium]